LPENITGGMSCKSADMSKYFNISRLLSGRSLQYRS